MGSEGSCPPPCQKLLLCSGCGGYGLKVQAEAQSKWRHQLSNGFIVRQSTRLLGIKNLINECFVKIGHPESRSSTLDGLGSDLIKLSRSHGLSDEDNAYCIERADQCETMIEDNQDDYLQEIGYVA